MDMEAITSFDQLDLTKQYTYADYLTWQFEDRVELFKGWVQRMGPTPRSMHQHISFELTAQISQYLRGKPCKGFAAPFDVRLTNKRTSVSNKEITTVLQPDLCVVCDTSKIDDLGCNGAPDWVIEILSPGNCKKEIKIKYELYQENGVREYWIVDPIHEYVIVFDLVSEKFVNRKMYAHDEPVPVGIFDGFSIDFPQVFEYQQTSITPGKKQDLFHKN